MQDVKLSNGSRVSLTQLIKELLVLSPELRKNDMELAFAVWDQQGLLKYNNIEDEVEHKYWLGKIDFDDVVYRGCNFNSISRTRRELKGKYLYIGDNVAVGKLSLWQRIIRFFMF